MGTRRSKKTKKDWGLNSEMGHTPGASSEAEVTREFRLLAGIGLLIWLLALALACALIILGA